MTLAIYFDGFSGCSGDMILGALLDAGLPLEVLQSGLSSLDIQGYQIAMEKVNRAAITATKFNVIPDEQIQQHARSLTDILKIIESSRLPDTVKKKSREIFQRLGEVEARIHGVDPNRVHFHEIGAVDSIIDIVGTVLALEVLEIRHFYSSALPVGSGYITTDHGILPVPAPATLELLSQAKAPIADLPQSFTPNGELLTPTGALLITTYATFRKPNMILNQAGYGAGSKTFEGWPNVLRVWIGEETDNPEKADLVLMETNIDDMNPQIHGYLMEKLFREKALDVWFTPIQMKKKRPAVMLSVLTEKARETILTDIILRETSTLGLRVQPVARHITDREIREFNSSLGTVKLKVKRLGTEILSVSPEYEDCRRIALERQMPLQEVQRIITIESASIINAEKNR